ncbi:MAG: hypothetical protein J6U43_05765 [Bacteroidales bacterium]|nr:hypothetical protein [Bacteroidales bacterium]
MKKTFLLLLSICALVVMAQGKYSPSALMILNEQSSMHKAKSTNKEQYIHATLEVSDHEVLEQYGIITGTQVGNFTTALVPVSVFGQLGNIPEISYINAGNESHLLLDQALPAIGYNQILTSNYTPEPYLGKGVIVGVVDLGFQWNHAAFRNADGSTRILAAWNQNDTSGSAPEKYNYGSLYDS